MLKLNIVTLIINICIIQICWAQTDCDYVKLIFQNFNKGYDANWEDNSMNCCKNLMVQCNRDQSYVTKL